MENLGPSDPTTTKPLVYDISLYLYIALANLLRTDGDSVLLCGHFCMWKFLYESHEDRSCGLLKECAQTESRTRFVILKESRKKSVCGLSVLQRKNWTTEEAKSTGPLFVKGLLHWISPWGHQAPLSGQIHPPLGTFHFYRKLDAWNGDYRLISTISSHTVSWSDLFFFCFDHLYWALFYW